MKQNINETKRMQRLAGLITESPGQGKFEILRQYVYDYLKCANQLEDNDDLETSLRDAKTWDDVEKAIDDYWGWEDEQTVWMLNSVIINIYLNGAAKYSCND